MTYTSSHITLQGIALWTFMPEKMKDYYKTHKWDLLAINIVAGVPDIDIFFGIHREYTHGIIIPTLILLLSVVYSQIMKKKNKYQSKNKRITRFVSLSMLMWIAHILIDLTWDAIMLFWPLDNHFYDLNLIFRLNASNLMLVGIIPQWQIYSKTEGQNMFFINLTQEQRASIFGKFLDLTFPQLTVEIVLAIVWFYVIILPMIKKKRKRSADTGRKSEKIAISNILKKQSRRQISAVGLLLILIGLMYGPSVGKMNTYEGSFAVYLANTDAVFDPTLGFSLENEKARNISLLIKTEITKVNYTAVLLIVDNNTFSAFFNNFWNITDYYYNNTLDYLSLEKQYYDLVDETINKSEIVKEGKITESMNEVSITLYSNIQDSSRFYILYLLKEWTINSSFMYKTTVSVNYVTERIDQFIGGIVIISFGVLVVVVDQTVSYLDYKKKK
ncbi:MAG: metal-dependent hydrolase [Candidatus Heimdallarchaeaceae archaeon]